MRLFLLENAVAGNVVRAIVCAPDVASSIDSDHAINFVMPNGRKIVLRHAGDSEFAVTEGQFAGDANDLNAAAVREAENSVSLEVVHAADNSEVPAFTFLDQEECVPVKKVSARIPTCRETTISDVWSFQANLAALREYEMRLRTESVVASLVANRNEMKMNRYTDELSQAAASLVLKPDLFLPLHSEINNTTVPCVVHLQGTDELGNFTAEIYWCEADAVMTGHVEFKNIESEPLFRAIVL